MAPNSPTLKNKEFMHAIHKIAVDVTFTKMKPKKGIKRHIKKGNIRYVQGVHSDKAHGSNGGNVPQ